MGVPATPVRAAEREDQLAVWPFFYAGTAVVAYGVLLLAIGKRRD